MGELMGAASWQEREIRQNEMAPHDAAFSANLCCILSLLTDGEVHRAEQSSGQRNGSVASDGDTLGTKSAFQVSRNAASNLVPEVGHSWLGRDTAVDSMGKAGVVLCRRVDTHL